MKPIATETTEAKEDFNYKLHFGKIAASGSMAVQGLGFRCGSGRRTFAVGWASPCSVMRFEKDSLLTADRGTPWELAVTLSHEKAAVTDSADAHEATEVNEKVT